MTALSVSFDAKPFVITPSYCRHGIQRTVSRAHAAEMRATKPARRATLAARAARAGRDGRTKIPPAHGELSPPIPRMIAPLHRPHGDQGHPNAGNLCSDTWIYAG